jgi:glycosyltransferase involved in cell wall biosynthesis
MWLERPTVVTRAMAVDEYVEDGRTGLLVDGSVEQWEVALRRLLDDDVEAERLARAGREHVRRTYTWDAYVTGILAELDEVVAERGWR